VIRFAFVAAFLVQGLIACGSSDKPELVGITCEIDYQQGGLWVQKYIYSDGSSKQTGRWLPRRDGVKPC